MKSPINLNAYFERIGYEGPSAPTVDTLKVLQEKHVQNIPFENLNPLLGIPVKLDPGSLGKKMIDKRRGGYCYEQNLLFKYVLEAIGFRVKGLTARIHWQKEENEITPRTHMLLQVNIDNNHYLADVGFGNYTMTGPISLETDIIQKTPHEERQLVKQGEIYTMQVQPKDTWEPLYRFDLRPAHLVDYELKSWYLSNNPDSHFVTGLIAARPAPGRRYTLKNNKFSIHYLHKETEKRTLNTTRELRNVLEETFLLELPDIPELDKSLQQLIESEKK